MKKWILVVLLTSTCFAGSSQVFHELRARADQAYANVEIMPAYNHGWFSDSNQKWLHHFIVTTKPQVVIEVGSWLGNSTIFMAQHMQPGAQLYAIDHFEGSIETDYLSDMYPTLYQQFLSNAIHANVNNTIIPIKQSSQEAFNSLNGKVKADLIYIDAAHDTESVYKDITMYSQLLDTHGIMTGDDWGWPSVRAAVERYAQEHGKQVVAEGNFWFYQP